MEKEDIILGYLKTKKQATIKELFDYINTKTFTPAAELRYILSNLIRKQRVKVQRTGKYPEWQIILLS